MREKHWCAVISGCERSHNYANEFTVIDSYAWCDYSNCVSAFAIGERGSDGLPGIPGQKGEPGQRGFDGLPGEKGDSGPGGMPGLNGRDGQKGDKGSPGLNGMPGKWRLRFLFLTSPKPLSDARYY